MCVDTRTLVCVVSVYVLPLLERHLYYLRTMSDYYFLFCVNSSFNTLHSLLYKTTTVVTMLVNKVIHCYSFNFLYVGTVSRTYEQTNYGSKKERDRRVLDGKDGYKGSKGFVSRLRIPFSKTN